ncbi:MAG: hypothetical protein K0B00_04510 [Rhodobacteraceae bacterium]|nr:hypothetical protein [Paracoccaceae bacterium]
MGEQKRKPGVVAFRAWAGAVAILVFLGGYVPYRLLAGGEPSLGIFAFWVVFGLVVTALIGLAVARWKE